MNARSKNAETLRHAERLIDYIQEHNSATVTEVVRNGLMSARDATKAIRCGIRHHVIRQEIVPHAPIHERVRYYLTGIPLMHSKQRDYSFDALLQAWGLTKAPPEVMQDAAG